MANRSWHVRKGFTLIEATMAMILLSVATAAVIMPFSAGAAMNMEGARRTIAAKLAGDLIEQIQKTDFDLIDDFYGSYVDGNGYLMDEMGTPILTDDVYTKFTRTVTECSTADVGGESLWWVTVRINYDGLELLKLSRLIGP